MKLLLLALLVPLVLAGAQAAPGFTKITAASGLEAIVNDKYAASPSWWLSGEHLVDLDNDGDLDLFLSAHGGGGAVAALNNGSGVFSLAPGSYPSTEVHLHHDSNEDGKTDLTMTYQDGGGQWWRNSSIPGNLSFTATGITRSTNTARIQALIDLNRDGKVDWLRSAPPGIHIDLGDGAGGFALSSSTITVPGTTGNNGASFIPVDLDGDGDSDLIVLAGGGYDSTPGKTIFLRNTGGMTFTDATASWGLPANGTLVKGIGDYDHDGDTDLIAVENKTMPPAIYLNGGAATFTKLAGAITGIPSATLTYSAWGIAVTTDFDNDGFCDIIMDGKYYLKVLRGQGDGKFTYMNTAWGIRDVAASSVDDGLCFGDIDRDGDLDIIGYRNIDAPRYLDVYRNDLPAQKWIRVHPVGLAGNKGAAGAKIRLYAAGTSQLLASEQVAIYCFQAANSYYGHAETERHYGLGSRATVDVEIQFMPSGKVVRVNGAAANGTVRILEASTGGNTPPQVSITSPANGAVYTAPAAVTVTATASDPGGNVANVEFFLDGTSIGTDTTSPYQALSSPAPLGTHTLTAKATDNLGLTTTSSPVTITVNPAGNTPPMCTLTGPANNATFPAPATIPITATASDSDGTISKVEFFNGTTKLGEDATSPYSTSWTGVAAGTYAVNARATDNGGATGISATATVRVTDPNDTDGDGMPNAWETQYGLNPNNAADASLDLDGDGSTNLQEFQAGTDPTSSSSVPGGSVASDDGDRDRCGGTGIEALFLLLLRRRIGGHA